MSPPTTPLFVKTHDFNLWLFERTARFPKRLRHSYTHRLETLALDFEQTLIIANSSREQARLARLREADATLACLRTLMRYAYDFETISVRQLEFSARQMDELGRLLGAWIKGSGR